MGPSIFKIEAEGDTLYIEAWTEDDAYKVLCRRIAPIPRSILTFTTVSRMEVPSDEEVLR